MTEAHLTLSTGVKEQSKSKSSLNLKLLSSSFQVTFTQPAQASSRQQLY